MTLRSILLSAIFAAVCSAASSSPAPAPAPEENQEKKESPPASRTASGESVGGYISLATKLVERGDLASAEIAFRAAVEMNDATLSERQDAAIALARFYRRQGAHSKAIALYERVLKDDSSDPHRPEYLLELGRSLRAIGAHRLAIARFYAVINSTLKINGDGFERYQLLAKTAQFDIAETHFESGNYVEAAKFFSRFRLLDLAPADRARAHFRSARALELSGDNTKAIPTYQEFVKEFPRDENAPEARFHLATLLSNANRRGDALAVTLESLRTPAPESRDAQQRWAYWRQRIGNQLGNDLFHAADFVHALAIYQELARLSEDANWKLPALYQAALCLERTGATAQASESYRNIIASVPKQASPALTDLVRMTEWRLEQLGWSTQAGEQIKALPPTVADSTPPAPPRPPDHADR